jgi:rsbT co-antagonist protein RsbR
MKVNEGYRASDAAEASTCVALRAEIAALRGRVAELERLRTETEVRHNEKLLQSIMDHSATVIFIKDCHGRYSLINRRFETLFHVLDEQMRGKTDYDLFPSALADRYRENDQTVVTTRAPVEVEEVVPSDDGDHTYISVKFPIFDSAGNVSGVCGIATDITERKRAELQQQLIDAQQVRLRELSTPLIPLAEGVLAIPLIGSVDSARSQQIMETLLEGITAHRARTAILDITGIKVMDGELAGAVTRAALAAKLLGAEVVLTGISPAAALVLIRFGVDLSDVMTLGTLQAGIAYALRR